MGVAAIDVPLYEFERLFQQFRLGVNGYAFVIDENGHILTHPDFRPLVSSVLGVNNEVEARDGNLKKIFSNFILFQGLEIFYRKL